MIKAKDKTPVSQDVVTMCTECKNELNHVVISHNMKGTIEKVKCHACGMEHKYAPENKKSPKKRVKRKIVDPERDFELLTEKFKDKTPIRYSMSGSFKVDDVIEHNTFGIGIVVGASHDYLDVIFSEQPRILACNR